MHRPQILFVDDEPNILSGLRRSLMAQRTTWALHWAQSGAAALELMAAQRVDIVVTDMRMPGMDGATLLDLARRDFPDTARIVLSGHADQDSIIAAAGSTHQFLSKPCDPAVLVQALESTLAARDLLADPSLRAILGGLENLPKPPGIFAELSELTSRPDCTIAEVTDLVERDVATAVELLKLVNSSFFGITNEVTTVARAVSLLGLDMIQALILAGRAFRPAGQLPPGLDPAELADRGMRSCIALRRAGRAEGWSAPLTGQLCLAALLYDVGLLVLADRSPDGWAQCQAAAEADQAQAQAEAFGCTIGQASAYLLGLWGFHPVIVGALAEQPVSVGDPVAMPAASAGAIAVAQARAETLPELPEIPATLGEMPADAPSRVPVGAASW
jgi:HD-like signal output (HDOD) protein/CheY-like chemotaxis protein